LALMRVCRAMVMASYGLLMLTVIAYTTRLGLDCDAIVGEAEGVAVAVGLVGVFCGWAFLLLGRCCAASRTVLHGVLVVVATTCLLHVTDVCDGPDWVPLALLPATTLLALCHCALADSPQSPDQ